MTTLGEHTSASGGAWLYVGAIVAHRDDKLPGVIIEADGDVCLVASIYDDDGTPVRAIRRGWLVLHEPDELEADLAAIIRG